jgi:hypothetical protein
MHQKERKQTIIKFDIVAKKKAGKMSKETNSEELFILPKILQQSDVKRVARDNEKRMTIAIET